MRNEGQIRIRVTEILNKLFTKNKETMIFYPENTIKKSGGGEKRDKNNSVNWYAKGLTGSYINVECVGMTMSDFIEEYAKEKIIIITTQKEIGVTYSLYKNVPTFLTTGYLFSVNQQKNLVKLKINDLFESIEIPITKDTPKWLLEEKDKFEFSCKIYLYWRPNNIELIKDSDFSKVWKTFRIERYLDDFEYEFYTKEN